MFFRVQIKESTKCWRLSQQLDRAITTVFKPVANHNFNVRSREEERGRTDAVACSFDAPSDLQIVHEKKKKSEGKMVRAERQVVLDMLFSAFEKHQHYNIKELVDITKQPVVSSVHTHTHNTQTSANSEIYTPGPQTHLPTLSCSM